MKSRTLFLALLFLMHNYTVLAMQESDAEEEILLAENNEVTIFCLPFEVREMIADLAKDDFPALDFFINANLVTDKYKKKIEDELPMHLRHMFWIIQKAQELAQSAQSSDVIQVKGLRIHAATGNGGNTFWRKMRNSKLWKTKLYSRSQIEQALNSYVNDTVTQAHNLWEALKKEASWIKDIKNKKMNSKFSDTRILQILIGYYQTRVLFLRDVFLQERQTRDRVDTCLTCGAYGGICCSASASMAGGIGIGIAGCVLNSPLCILGALFGPTAAALHFIPYTSLYYWLEENDNDPYRLFSNRTYIEILIQDAQRKILAKIEMLENS